LEPICFSNRDLESIERSAAPGDSGAEGLLIAVLDNVKQKIRSGSPFEEEPHILLRETGGKVSLYTNYFLRNQAAGGGFADLVFSDEFLAGLAEEICDRSLTEREPEQGAGAGTAEGELPDEDIAAYAGRIAAKVAEKEREQEAAESAGGLSRTGRNIMLRMIHFCAGSGGRGDKKGKLLSKLSVNVIDMAVSGCSGARSKEDLSVLDAAGHFLGIVTRS
jgi:hypothetical protein